MTQETVAMMKFAEEDFENTDEDTADDDEDREYSDDDNDDDDWKEFARELHV